MSSKQWYISKRTMLPGMGAAIALFRHRYSGGHEEKTAKS